MGYDVGCRKRIIDGKRWCSREGYAPGALQLGFGVSMLTRIVVWPSGHVGIVQSVFECKI